MKTYQEFLAETLDTSKVAKEVADLIDIEGWSVSKAKAEFKKRTGIVIKGRSKDEVSNLLRKM